jgi:DNA-binding MarR family transcriptional regulator
VQHMAKLAAEIEAAMETLTSVLEAAGDQRPAPVSATQLRVLGIVRDRPDLNVNRLAEALNVVASSASRLCDRLEALGLLRRVADPQDRREVQLRMTPAAQQILDELSRRRREALAAVLSRMSGPARRELARSLAAFSAAAVDRPVPVGHQRTA